MINVAIVEDIDDIRKGLAMIINSSDDTECKHTFSTAEKAFEVLSVQPVDVVLVDINLPGGMNGIELVHQLKPIHPAMQFMMCTVYEDSELVFKALKVGATGYISAEEYARLIGVAPADLGPRAFAENPLLMRQGGRHVVRAIQAIEP